MHARILLALLFLTPGLGYADAPPRVADRAHNLCVEFDELDGDVIHRSGHWLLEVEYEVEIKRPRGLTPLVLLVDVTEGGRPLLNERGEPLRIAIPLDRPQKHNRREIEFEGRVVVPLDPRSFARPDFELHGVVILPPHDTVVARRRGDADFDRPRRWRPFLGVGVGFGPVGVGIGF